MAISWLKYRQREAHGVTTRIFRLAPLVMVAPLWAQSEMNLDQILDLAIRNNREIAAARLEVKKNEDSIAASKTYKLPQFRVNVFGFAPLTNLNFTFPAGVFGTFPATGPIPPTDTTIGTPRRFSAIILAGADQSLTQFHRINLGISLQDLNRQIAMEKIREMEQSVANRVKSAYYDVVQAQSALEANQQAQKLYHEIERVAQQGLDQQVILPADLLDAQQRIAESELDQIQLDNGINTGKSQLNILMGRDLDTPFQIAGSADIPTLQLDPASARATALQQRPETREARLKLRQAEVDRDLKRSEYIPDVSLSVNYLGLGHVNFVPANTVAVGFLVSWNPFDWGRKKWEVASKITTIEQARNSVAETEARISLEVEAKRRTLDESRARLKVSDIARRAARERLRVMLDRQEQQAAQLKDTLQMQAALAEANFKYQKDVIALGKAKAEFDKAVGSQ